MTRVLMIYPKFIPNSFWNYTEACELVGAKYPAAPLGLITVAALCPKEWDFRLINRNTEPLTDEDLDWADLDHARRHAEPAAGLSLSDRACAPARQAGRASAGLTFRRARIFMRRRTSR